MEWFVEVKFEPRDMWVGVFWDRKLNEKNISNVFRYWDIYICIIPMFPIHIFQGIKF